MNGAAKGRCQTVNYREVSKREGRGAREIFLPFIQDIRPDIAKTLEPSAHSTDTAEEGINGEGAKTDLGPILAHACHGATWPSRSSQKRLRGKLEVLIGIPLHHRDTVGLPFLCPELK